MACIRNVIAVELHSIDDGGISYCEKDWVRDPWIQRSVEKAARSLSAEAAPPLLPSPPVDRWSNRGRRLPPSRS